MEIEQLKQYWTHLHTEPQQAKAVEELERMLRKQGKRIQGDLLTNLRKETLWLIWTILPLTYAAVHWRTYGMLLIAAVLMLVPLGMIYYGQIRQVKRLDLGNSDLRAALMTVEKWLRKHLKRLWLLTHWGMPLVGAFGILTGVYLQAGENGLEALDLKSWGIIGLLWLVYAVISIIFARWYVHRLYGIHYQAIQACLTELSPISASASSSSGSE